MKRSFAYALTTVLLWSTMAAMVKALLGAIPNLEILSISSVFAFLFLLLVNGKTGSLRQLRSCTGREVGTMCALGFLGLFLYSALYYYGLSQLTSQEACILNYLWPMMLVAFSCLILKERMTVLKAAAMLCSFLGIVILSAGSGSAGEGSTALGILSCVAAAACYGLFSVLNKKADLDQNLTMMVIWLTTAVCALILGLLTETWVPVRGIQWLGILWLGVGIDAVAYLLWALALKEADNTAVIANLAYLTPFLSLIVSAVFLKEAIRPRAVVALVFIIGGILLQSLFDRKNAA